MESKILVMEDDVQLCRLYCKALNAAGFHTYPTHTLMQAIDSLQSHHFDVFICDMHIGSQHSGTLLRNFQHRLARHGTHIVIVSGQAQYRSMAEELGIPFFLEKPVSMHTLVTLMERITKTTHIEEN
jgi:DNA-binding NtrC family response regulator